MVRNVFLNIGERRVINKCVLSASLLVLYIQTVVGCIDDSIREPVVEEGVMLLENGLWFRKPLKLRGSL
jgi:hypothetical protein